MSSPIKPKDAPALPLVALVGRPNVGKSTLFNRLVKKRKAITDPTPGVTRDPVTEVWEREGRKVLLVDTGGIRLNATGFDKEVTKRSVDTLKRADCIVLLADVDDVTGEDEEVFQSLRPYAEKVILAVNKVDTEKRDDLLGEFWSYGFSEVLAVSAAHGRNCEDLSEAVFSRIDFSRYPAVSDDLPKPEFTIAILGKPNTGKSTLVNTLLGEDRAIVSDVPGTTRDVLEGTFTYGGKLLRILDTAGIRRKTKVKEDIEYYSVNRAIGSVEEADVVFLLIDSVEGLADQDKKIAAQIVKKGRGVILVLSKWDLQEGGKKKFLEAEDRLRFQFPVLEFAPIVPVSAKTRWNLDVLLQKAFRIREQLEKRVETGLLNRNLEHWVAENPPPLDGRRRFKLRFMTQVRVNPVRFVLFMNHAKGFPEAYVGYLKNKIRKVFGFPDIPFDLEVKDKG